MKSQRWVDQNCLACGGQGWDLDPSGLESQPMGKSLWWCRPLHDDLHFGKASSGDQVTGSVINKAPVPACSTPNCSWLLFCLSRAGAKPRALQLAGLTLSSNLLSCFSFSIDGKAELASGWLFWQGCVMISPHSCSLIWWLILPHGAAHWGLI